MSGGAGPAALVMARAPRPGAVKRHLEPLLGPGGCARLQALLIARAAAWAHGVAPGSAHVAIDPPDALAEVEPLLPAGVSLFAREGADEAERTFGAAGRALAGRDGPLLLAGVSVPALARAHASAALGDLACGCEVSIGPALAGGWYLLALARPHLGLLVASSDAGAREEAMGLSLTAAREAGLGVGLLRAERDLESPADVAATLADPLTPPEVRRALTGPRG